ncbi:MAG: tetratricopeptide repeat protein [Gammaproteobacteria bacterium]|nr:tetratricopeptide repeat protein [Gammaproteobacteria bacterium]
MKKQTLNLNTAKRKAEALLQQNHLPEAKLAFEEICQVFPGNAEIWLNYGAVNGMLGDLVAAENAFRQAITINPSLTQAQFNLGQLLIRQGRLHEAEPCWRTYTRLKPEDGEGPYQLANILKRIGKPDESLSFYRSALQLQPKNADLIVNYGEALRLCGQPDAAATQYQAALALAPNSAQIYLFLNELHIDRYELVQAETALNKALTLDPSLHSTVLQGKASLRSAKGDFLGALQYLDEAVQRFPDDVTAHWGRSLQLLLLGRYAEGWQEHEWRTRFWRWQLQMGKCDFNMPRWNGEPLQGRTILVYAEQGFGDTIQFVRYVPLLAEKGAKVIFYCQAELIKLLQNIPGITKIAVKNYEQARSESCDFHIPLMSLPHFFGTTIDTIPSPGAYLKTDPALSAQWRQKINPEYFNVGLVWAGSGFHVSNQRRTAGLKDFSCLSTAPNTRFYSLQKGSATTQIKSSEVKLDLVDLSTELNDFADTAAVIDNLDLIITVDTAAAHLAGALGKCTWTLLYFPPEWRWLLDREDSPWYRSMRLFRRAADGDWSNVTQRICAELAKLSADKK